MNPLTEAEVAWLAGLFEGEGCLTTHLDRGRPRWSLIVSMTDRDVVERASRLAGIGGITTPRRQHDHWKPLHYWRVTRREDVAALVSAIRPWLGERRGQRVDEFLAWYANAEPGRSPAGTASPTCGVCQGPRVPTSTGKDWYCRACSATRMRRRRALAG